MAGPKWITFPKQEGIVSRQAHTDLPAGSYERELGRDGFSGSATHMYHSHKPTDWVTIDGPLRPHAFDTTKMTVTHTSPWDAESLLENDQVLIRLWRLSASMPFLVRNGDGDELLFIHEGAGELFCDYGRLSFRDGDYIVLPRGTMWRIEVNLPVTILLIEASNGHYTLPDKGMVGQHAVFDPALLDTPKIDADFNDQKNEMPTQVLIKRSKHITTMTYPFNPLDATGWKGDLSPVRINWRDIRPLMSHRYHLPPSAHTTFVGCGFVVCTFCPRPIESDPGALKVPFFHSNEDYDEVIFYHKGEFFSRDNIHPGMITLHPCGLPHGPHPKAFDKGKGAQRKETDEVAVMIDARNALKILPAADQINWADYVDSWKGVNQ
ncbi:Homogentisate 1,2-dioxygenase [hydrothermal vent metagenome]|uniref:Homogentisate 1,2-dioxygenase n=1 Tax=hydrothermal vent metagenome TaxID=652676 RepID=A0A3B0ZRE1_9ZZZZ